MSDLERLSLETDDETEQLLLRAGRPRAPRSARERAWIAASGVVASSSLAAGSVAAKVGSVVGGKLIVVIAFTGLAAVGGAVVLQQRHRASEPLPAPTVVAKPAPLPSIAPAPAAPAPAPVESVDARPVASIPITPSVTPTVTPPRAAAPVAPMPTESATSSMPSELAALQQARAALGAGDPARALSRLDAYGARFPHGVMSQEAAVLRIEALVRAGDRPAAQRAADAYIGAHPQSPYLDRIRSLLGTNP